MAWLDSAVKAASAFFGTAPWGAGQPAGDPAGGTAFSATFDAGVARSIVDSMDAGDLYATQPHLRTVVSFVARNGAQLGRHVYKKTDDGRERVKNSPGADLLAKPNDYQTGFDLFNMLFSELALYDMAIWVPSLGEDGWKIDPIPGEWITGIKKADAFHQAGYQVKYPTSNTAEFLPASQVIVFRGYSPHGFQRGSSAVRALRGTLAEQVAAINFREQMWRRGGRVGMYMTRPKDAPEWSKEAKTKFVQNWRSNWSGNGPNAGDTPLLEDGMELKRVGFNAKEEQWLEAATLSLSTVAGAYHVPPAMVGVSGYNSFASVKEFRKMLYTETMGPSIAQVEETINKFLFPFIGEPSGNYLELNIQEKLQGDFEEQAAVMQAAVGGPYMTVNEARERANLPKIDGGDELLAPLNMGAAGNNGPLADEPIDPEPSGAAESDDPDEAAPKANGSHVAERRHNHQHTKAASPADDALTDDLAAFFARQERAMLGKKAPAGWNQKRWNAELAAILEPHAMRITAKQARKTAAQKKLDPDDYSVGETRNFLKAVSDSRADLINATTRDQLDALEAGEDYEDGVKHVFQVAREARAPEASTTMTTFLVGFAVVEVAKQLAGDKGPTKTWVATPNPNSRHAGMDGETVPINEKFSNGADWPGDPVLGAEGTANCLCGVDINYND